MIIFIMNCQLINLAHANSTNKIEEVSTVSFKTCFKVKMHQAAANINHSLLLKGFPNMLFIQGIHQPTIDSQPALMPVA